MQPDSYPMHIRPSTCTRASIAHTFSFGPKPARRCSFVRAIEFALRRPLVRDAAPRPVHLSTLFISRAQRAASATRAVARRLSTTRRLSAARRLSHRSTSLPHMHLVHRTVCHSESQKHALADADTRCTRRSSFGVRFVWSMEHGLPQLAII